MMILKKLLMLKDGKYIVNGNEIRGNKFPSTDSRFMAYYDRWVKENGRKQIKMT